MAEHNELGKKGEKLAIDFLIKNKFKILEKNYRYLKAEVDIIAQKKDVLAVVEVKTRSTDYFGNPQDLDGTLLWLVSDASKFVTGIVVPVDGGFSAFSGV